MALMPQFPTETDEEFTLIFFCRACFTPFEECADQEWGQVPLDCNPVAAIEDFVSGVEFSASLAFDNVRNVIVSEEIYKSIDKVDSNCKFKEVLCNRCMSRVGRYYTQVPISLGPLKNQYSLEIKDIMCYKLPYPDIDFAHYFRTRTLKLNEYIDYLENYFKINK